MIIIIPQVSKWHLVLLFELFTEILGGGVILGVFPLTLLFFGCLVAIERW